MHIKRLELRGFKSFADKTELHLADGVTAVVGPNGSGKSNLADAIKWVLGEQSAKALRGARMDELIFSGTKTRRGLGLAEVSLIFNNERGRFPLAYNEIAVTRRVFKSGESEYYLNKSKCRLRDIQNLFLDTGIGKDAYSFIGQGRIDELLSARPEDRRAIFEEVAGIAKYKARKRETENKLQDAEAALTRINDLLYELANEQEPLEIEAERAEEYMGINANLKKVEQDLLLYELNMAERRQERDTRLRQDLQDKSQEKEARLLQAEAVEENLRLQLVTMQEDLERSNQMLLAAVRQREQLASQERILINRQIDKQAQATTLQARLSELKSQKQVLTSKQETSKAALESARQATADAESVLEACTVKLANHATNRSELLLAEAETRLEGLVETESEATLAANLWQDRVAQASNELAAASEQCQDLEQQQTKTGTELADMAAERISLAADVQAQAAAVSALEAEQTATEDLLGSSLDLQHSLRQEHAVLQSRYAVLREVVDRLEGYQRGVRELLQAKQEGAAELQQIVGVVGDLLEVDKKYEEALEVALGGSVQFLVAATEASAQKGIEWLKRHRMGRATFLPLDVIRPRTPRSNDLAGSRLPGAIGFAADLVSYDPQLENIVRYLLGHILVVETLPQALAIARRTNHQVRMVTLTGDVLMPGGSLSGGSRQRQGSSLLGRSRELERLHDEQAELAKQLAKQRRQTSGQQEKQEKLLAVISQQAAKLEEQQTALRELSGRESALTQALAELDKRLNAARAQLAQIKSKLAASKASKLQSESELQAAIDARQRQQELLAELRQQATGSRKEREALGEQTHQAELALVGLREQIASRERELDSAQQRLAELKTEIDKDQAEMSALISEQATDSCDLDKLKADIAEWAQAEVDCQTTLTELKTAIAAADKHLRGNREQVKEARDDLEQDNKQLNNVELRLSRLEADCESMVKRLQRDFGVKDRSGLHSTLQSRTQGEEKQAELQDELLQLGPVRVSAVAELARLNERITFLRTQKEDVLTSCQSLTEIIGEMDQIMAKRFTASFVQIRRSFLRMFQELFGGGEAELRLSDPDNPLVSGIEIMAQPSGKNLQNIDLLSGGEKALTAIALLCATLEVRPTPFCLLDEIDASLDDVNTRRFMQVIARLAEETQFILITHSKETMLAVDTLYGVTMPEHGISQLISVELSDIEN